MTFQKIWSSFALACLLLFCYFSGMYHLSVFSTEAGKLVIDPLKDQIKEQNSLIQNLTSEKILLEEQIKRLNLTHHLTISYKDLEYYNLQMRCQE